MPNQPKSKGQKPTRFSVHQGSMHIASLSIVLLLPIAQPQAETIYRCGDDYSTSPICADGRSTAIRTPSESHTTERDKTSTAAHDLREANALEKNRLRLESRASLRAPAQAMGTHQNIQLSEPDAPAADVRHNGRYTRRLQSPYFTAKDLNSPPKKKSSAKTLPPVAN